MNEKGIISGLIVIMLLGSFILGNYILSGISDIEQLSDLPTWEALKLRRDSTNMYVELDKGIARGWANYVYENIHDADDCDISAYSLSINEITTSIDKVVTNLSTLGSCSHTLDSVSLGTTSITTTSTVSCSVSNDKLSISYGNEYIFLKHLTITKTDGASDAVKDCQIDIKDNSNYLDIRLTKEVDVV